MGLVSTCTIETCTQLAEANMHTFASASHSRTREQQTKSAHSCLQMGARKFLSCDLKQNALGVIRVLEVLMNAIVIDAQTRELKVFAASVTLACGGLVLRKAVEVGQLADLTKEGPLEVPRDGEQAGVVIVMGDYRAQSSAGFTRRVGSEKFGENFVVGGVGFTYPVFSEDGSRKEVGACLRPFRDIVPVTIVRANAVRKVATHANSNPETAAAAMVGLGLRPGLIVAEGQSDYTSAWQVEGASEVGEIPAEHRGDIFTPERLVGVAAGKKYRAANLKAWASEGWLEPIDRAPSKMTEALTALLGQELLRQTATSLLEESPVVETPVEG